MIADNTSPDRLEWLTAPWASTTIALLALAVLAGLAWKLGWRYGLPRLDLAGRLSGLLVMRGRTPGEPPAPQHRGAPEAEGAATGAAPPQPVPLPDAADGAAPSWLPKALVVIASVPTLLALPWAAYAVSQHLPVPAVVALPLGVLFDVAMVGAVLVALLVPSVSRQASALGWVAASAAAVAIAAHTGLSGALIFAATPLISKALWGLLIIIRRQQAAQRAAQAAAQHQREQDEEAARAAQAEADAARAERDAELSEELTHEQKIEIAVKRRQAKFKLDMAAAELELEKAESEAEHQRALAEIKRLGEQQRAEDKEAAEVFEQRVRLERQLSTLKGDAPAFLTRGAPAEEAEVVGEITAQAGFGGAAPSFGFQRPLDVKALTPEGAAVRFEDLPATHQALVKYVHTAKEPTMREAGRKLDRDGRTIGRWVEKLAELGYELPFDRKK